MFQLFRFWRTSRCRPLGAVVVLGAVAITVLGRAGRANEPPQLKVLIDFPSGSGEVESMDHASRVIRTRPTPHEGRGWACWWYFKVSGIEPGETIAIDMGGNKWAQPDRATYSTDGKHWKHTQPGEKRKGRILYRQPVDAPAAWFAWGPPFTEDDAAELVDWVAAKSPYAEAWTLCQTREGRPVSALRIAQPGAGDTERYGIWINARQHAWESGSSWVCRGLVEWLVSDDPRAESLRRKATVCVVPVMDVDNVALGAGGKNQQPHDHNRDWSDDPHFPEVASAQRHIKQLERTGRFDLYLDLHNPAPENRDPFFYVPPTELLTEVAAENLERFLLAARSELTGPLAFQGHTVTSNRGNDPRWVRKSAVWVVQNTGDHVLGQTLEVPWNTPHSTTAGYRNVGRKVGLALERYFRLSGKGGKN